MQMKTTVNGFTLQRLHPHLGEIEKWSVDKDRIHLGFIAKINSKAVAGVYPFKFWYALSYKKVGWREIQEIRVANCRRDAVAELARIKKLT